MDQVKPSTDLPKTPHEPCTSREDCFHVRGGHAGSREGKVLGGHIAGRKAVDSGHLGNVARLGGLKAVETGQLDSIRGLSQTKAAQQETGKKAVESGSLKRASQKAHELFAAYPEILQNAGRKASHEDKVAAGRASARKMSGSRPRWNEVRFYGLVFGNPIISEGFTAQQSDGHGVYDGAWIGKKIIAELDGGGHHAFRDRHGEDTRKDIARMLEYNTVLREQDENVLFLKALAILEAKQ